MAKNNFKELENMLAKDKDFVFEKVGNNLVGTRNMFGFIGDIIEHFIPRILEVFIGIAGGNQVESKNSKYPHEGGKA